MALAENVEDYAVQERELYEPVETYLNVRFSGGLKPLRGECFTVSAITATAGTLGAGQWTRPDVALIAVWKNKFSPVVHLDLYGFEVKTSKGCNVSSVHEALAQNRLVHYSYLVWHVPPPVLETKRFLAIYESCEAYGVGLITFHRQVDASTFTTHLLPQRAEPTPNAVDEFIETRFTEADRNRVLKFLPSLHDVRRDR